MNLHQHIYAELNRLPPDELRNWREIHGLKEHNRRMRIRCVTMPQWTETHRKHVAHGLREWCYVQDHATDLLRGVMEMDRRLSVWLSCSIARSVLQLVPLDEKRPRVALDATEQWVRAELRAEDLEEPTNDAWQYADALQGPRLWAARAASYPSFVVLRSEWDGIVNAAFFAEQTGLFTSVELRDIATKAIETAIDAAAHGYETLQNRR